MRKNSLLLTPKTGLLLALIGVGLVGQPHSVSARQFKPFIIESEAQLSQLLDEMHSPQDAYDIRTKYFVWGKGASLPIEQGIKVLDAAIGAQTTRSSRLIWLKNVRASISFSLPEFDLNDGYKAYNEIFAIPKTIGESEKIAVLDAIGNYVNSVPYSLDRMGLQSDPRTRDTLIKAWQAYIHLGPFETMLPEEQFLENGNRAKYVPNPPNFVSAFWSIGASGEVSQAVTQSLADPSVPRTYETLVAAANAVMETAPEQATRWLLEAKQLIPAKEQDVRRWRLQSWDLYHMLRASLVAQKQWEQAIIYQRECIEKLGAGRGELWVLLGKTGDTAAQRAIVEELKKPEMPVWEVLEAAKLMAENAPNAPQGEATPDIEILRAYLTSNRTTSSGNRLDARILLAKILKKRGQLGEALIVAKNDKPADSPFLDESKWSELEQVRQSILEK